MFHIHKKTQIKLAPGSHFHSLRKNDVAQFLNFDPNQKKSTLKKILENSPINH